MIRSLLVFITAALLCVATSYADTTIYCPYTMEPVYTYKHAIIKNEALRSYKITDFIPVKEDGWMIDLAHPVNYRNGVPLDGYDYWFWSRGLNLPKKNYGAYTFYVKDDEGNFEWRPWEVELHEFVVEE